MDESDLLEELDLGEHSAPRQDTLERVRLQGRTPEPFMAEYARDLTTPDIEALALPRGVRPAALKRIHASHHALAKCIASGMRANQAALVTGYHPARISQLTADPAFAALIKDYQNEAKSIFADLAERMSNLSLDAIELIQERLHDAPETFSIPVLLDLVRTFADRTGHGPNQEVSLKVSSDFIDRPPRETLEEWSARRAKELEPPVGVTRDRAPLRASDEPPKRLN
jgi:hypothetical protein